MVPGPAVRMYPIVSKGTVDGWASLPVMDAYTFNLLDVTRSCTILEGGLGQATFSIMMNKDVWNGLKRSEQQQIMSASGEKLARTSQHWQALSAKQRADFVKAGKQVVTRAAGLPRRAAQGRTAPARPVDRHGQRQGDRRQGRLRLLRGAVEDRAQVKRVDEQPRAGPSGRLRWHPARFA